MRGGLLGVCVAVAPTAGGAAYLGGSAAVAAHTSLAPVPLRL
jgi:hypothetical protein